ncbi:Nucleotide-binding universal stress protein, UspA family [Tranquillimonas rosea]|uniref:Nucleotide-binding universal stress protein, UspA family n=1 Tax=Tranquillimonas rosea TaxID=641238 RepID=A0A1H9X980_9RHOB|nr:universal stress protein [Tranquillimonas rosea]SES42629.1 Nucleotide-binding universal stress protein, UspA family [Tranquillimonas rosea]
MTRETKLILCPINLRHAEYDYGEYEEAVAMAQRRNAKLILMTVAPEFERNLNIQDTEGYWRDVLQKFLKSHPAGDIDLEVLVRKGSTHREIVKVAKERKVDVIVIGSANPRVKDYLLGTTASHVASYSPCSVYVVRN